VLFMLFGFFWASPFEARFAFGADDFLSCFAQSCHSNYWLWYPRTPPGMPYGNRVKLSPRGTWIHQDGTRSWTREPRRNTRVLSADNPDDWNGEIAYRTAYESFQRGKESGRNKIESVYIGYRWKKRITTEDGIVLLKDDFNNVAIQSPEGKWHVVNGRGQYAATTPSLSSPGSMEIIAKADLSREPLGNESSQRMLADAKKGKGELSQVQKKAQAKNDAPLNEKKPVRKLAAVSTKAKSKKKAQPTDRLAESAQIPDAAKKMAEEFAKQISKPSKTEEPMEMAVAAGAKPAPSQAPAEQKRGGRGLASVGDPK